MSDAVIEQLESALEQARAALKAVSAWDDENLRAFMPAKVSKQIRDALKATERPAPG